MFNKLKKNFTLGDACLLCGDSIGIGDSASPRRWFHALAHLICGHFPGRRKLQGFAVALLYALARRFGYGLLPLDVFQTVVDGYERSERIHLRTEHFKVDSMSAEEYADAVSEIMCGERLATLQKDVRARSVRYIPPFGSKS